MCSFMPITVHQPCILVCQEHSTSCHVELKNWDIEMTKANITWRVYKARRKVLLDTIEQMNKWPFSPLGQTLYIVIKKTFAVCLLTINSKITPNLLFAIIMFNR